MITLHVIVSNTTTVKVITGEGVRNWPKIDYIILISEWSLVLAERAVNVRQRQQSTSLPVPRRAFHHSCIAKEVHRIVQCSFMVKYSVSVLPEYTELFIIALFVERCMTHEGA